MKTTTLRSLMMKRAMLCFIIIFSFSFFIPCSAQIAINNTSSKPDVSAILDLKTGNIGVNKGFLPNAVALTATNSASPVGTPATGLIVYNTATAGSSPNNVVPGYYYWNGSAWLGMGAPSSGSGTNNYIARWTPNGNTLGTGMIQDNGTSVGIDTVPVSGNTLYVNSNTGTAIYGRSSNFGSYGVYGIDINYGGVYGYGGDYGGNFLSPAGYGVKGAGAIHGGVFSSTGEAAVLSTSSNAAGDSSVGATYGVYGITSDVYGIYSGVYAKDENGTGVYGFGGIRGGFFEATAGPGVYGQGTTYGGQFYATAGAGIRGKSASAAGDSSIGTTYGVYGYSPDPNGQFAGVYGQDDNLVGVLGYSANGFGVYGESANGYGVFGYSTNGFGVYGNGFTGSYFKGTNAAGDSSTGATYGVYGITTDPAFQFAGVYGQDDNNIGVEGVSYSGDGVYGQGGDEGVYGLSTGNAGVYGEGDNAKFGYGVEGISANNIGVLGSGGVIGGEFESSTYAIIVPSGQGSVGIATTQPTTLMQIGNANTTSGQFSVFSQDFTNGQIQIGNPNSNGEASMGFISGVGAFGDGAYSSNGGSNMWNIGAGNWGIGAGKFSIANAGLGGPVITFTSAGLVGIGCNSPLYHLDVAGDIRAQGSIYYGGNACSTLGTAYSKPDYVFEPDYTKTYSPFEVEKFILKEGHLPWVTSAAEEKKENKGAIDITRMSFQTLEATECIQMQVIEQQKTIEDLKQQNEELRSQNEEFKKQLAVLTNNVESLLNKQK